jgi:hypothetical protein
MEYLSPCRRGLLPLKKRRKIVAGAAAASRKGHPAEDGPSSSVSNVIEPSPGPGVPSSKRSARSAKLSSIGALASAAAFASSSIVSASSTSDAAAPYTERSDSASAVASAPSIPVLQGTATATISSPPAQSSPANKSRISYQDRRFTDSDPPESRCQATTTRGRACAFVSVVGAKYCNVHANYDTAPPPRRSGFGDGGDAKVPASTTPRKAGAEVTSLSTSTPQREHNQTPTDTVHVPNGANRLLLNDLPSVQWPKKIVEIAIGPFAGEKGIVMKFGNGWVTVKVKGSDGKPLHHNRRSMELYLLPKVGRQGAPMESSPEKIGGAWGDPIIATPSSPGKGSSSNEHATASPLSPRSGREIHKPKRYDSSEDEEIP